VAHALRTYARKEIVTEDRGQGRVIDVIVARPNGRAGTNQELAKYIGTVKFRLIGMRMTRRAVRLVVAWKGVFGAMV
jgi:alkylated DNA nucleotide flippase Atl1